MTIFTLFFAFCGGALAAMIGALASWVLAGITLLFGIVAAMCGADFDWINVISFGGYFGPGIAFVGGAAAAAYARKRGYLDSGKDIATALITLKKSDVIIIGGVAAVVGQLVLFLLAHLGLSGVVDNGALTIVIVGILVKILTEGSLFGELTGEDAVRGRFHVESSSWNPNMTRAIDKTLNGFVASGVAAYVTYVMLQSGSEAVRSVAAFVPFAISTSMLIFAMFGVELPATHHISLVTSYVLVSGGSIPWALVFGITAAWAADFLSRLIYVHGDTHIDPPACSIMVCSFFAIFVFPSLGLYSAVTDVVPWIIIVAYFAGSIVAAKKNRL